MVEHAIVLEGCAFGTKPRTRLYFNPRNEASEFERDTEVDKA